jgi:hypothetical protein
MHPPHETVTILRTFLTLCAFLVMGAGLVLIAKGVLDILRSAIGPLNLPNWMRRQGTGASPLPTWRPIQRPAGGGHKSPSPRVRSGGSSSVHNVQGSSGLR